MPLTKLVFTNHWLLTILSHKIRASTIPFEAESASIMVHTTCFSEPTGIFQDALIVIGQGD